MFSNILDTSFLFLQIILSSHLNRRNINLGGGGNNIGLVDATQRHTVDLVRTSDEQKTAFELLQDNDTLALVAASQQNSDGARSDRGAKTRSLDDLLLSNLARSDILSRVEARSLLCRNHALATVLLAADLNCLVGCGCERHVYYDCRVLTFVPFQDESTILFSKCKIERREMVL